MVEVVVDEAVVDKAFVDEDEDEDEDKDKEVMDEVAIDEAAFAIVYH